MTQGRLFGDFNILEQYAIDCKHFYMRGFTLSLDFTLALAPLSLRMSLVKIGTDKSPIEYETYLKFGKYLFEETGHRYQFVVGEGGNGTFDQRMLDSPVDIEVCSVYVLLRADSINARSFRD
jgi:hypothetical protein